MLPSSQRIINDLKCECQYSNCSLFDSGFCSNQNHKPTSCQSLNDVQSDGESTYSTLSSSMFYYVDTNILFCNFNSIFIVTFSSVSANVVAVVVVSVVVVI
eukprot:Pgem_evm1s5258